MNDPLRILRSDHREVERLLTRLADTSEGQERDRMVAEVCESLSAHLTMEEQLVYPLVAEHVGADDEEEAEVEHGLARDGMAKMRELQAEPGFGAVVEMLKAGIMHHVQEEESEMLPELRHVIGKDEWERLGDAMVEAKRAAGMPVPTAHSPQRRSQRRTPATNRSK